MTMIINGLVNFFQTDIGQSTISAAVNVADGALTGAIAGVALGILAPICYFKISSMINGSNSGFSGILIVATTYLGVRIGAVAGGVAALGYEIYRRS